MSNNESSIHELVNRIEILEKKQGRYRLGILGLLGLGMMMMTPSVIDRAMAKAGDTLIAKKIALMDDDGTVRVLMSAGKTVDSGAQISLFGKGGKPRAIIATSGGGKTVDSGAQISLFGKGGKPRAIIATSGGPKLSLYDPSGVPQVNLAILDNEPGISIHDKKGKLMGIMAGLQEHGGHLMVLDREGKVTWQSSK